jgi:hypothetical protein
MELTILKFGRIRNVKSIKAYSEEILVAISNISFFASHTYINSFPRYFFKKSDFQNRGAIRLVFFAKKISGTRKIQLGPPYK